MRCAAALVLPSVNLGQRTAKSTGSNRLTGAGAGSACAVRVVGACGSCGWRMCFNVARGASRYSYYMVVYCLPKRNPKTGASQNLIHVRRGAHSICHGKYIVRYRISITCTCTYIHPHHLTPDLLEIALDSLLQSHPSSPCFFSQLLSCCQAVEQLCC